MCLSKEKSQEEKAYTSLGAIYYHACKAQKKNDIQDIRTELNKIIKACETVDSNLRYVAPKL